MTPLPYFTGWNQGFGNLPLWSGYQKPSREEEDAVRQRAMSEAMRIYGGRPDQGQIQGVTDRLMGDFRDRHFAETSGTMVPRALSNEGIADRIGDMRDGYRTDPNYFRNLLPDGFEGFARSQPDLRTGDMAEGLGPQNNFSLGPVDSTNFMFLGSRGARPQDNPASSAFKVNEALRELGMPGPNYTLPQAASPAQPGVGNLAKAASAGDPLSYVVATDQELDRAGNTFRYNNMGGYDYSNPALKQADDWSQEQARIQQQQAYDAAFKQAGNDFAQWALFNVGDPDVKAAFGNADGLVDPRTLRADATSWFAQNSDSDLAKRGLRPGQVGALQNPVRAFTDPSWGALNQFGSQTMHGDFGTMMGDRESNRIRQRQAYNSIGDGQWGGVLNQQTYSQPDFRQITGQQPAQMSPFGGLGGLGGSSAFQMPSLGSPGMATGAAYNPNPFAALSGDDKNKSPWGGPWGGR